MEMPFAWPLLFLSTIYFLIYPNWHSVFANAASLERLVGAVDMEIDEAWLCEPARYVILDRE